MCTPIKSVLECKNDCCGCAACYSVCPQSAIKMEEDEEGFVYPVINHIICNGCCLCRTVCPIRYVDSIT